MPPRSGKRKSYGDAGERRLTRSQSKLKEVSQASSSSATASATTQHEVFSGVTAACPASSFSNLGQADKTLNHWNSLGSAEIIKAAESFSDPKLHRTVTEAEVEDNSCRDDSSQLEAALANIHGSVDIPSSPASSFKNLSRTEYRVKEKFVPILRNILEKHGDIAINYIMKTPEGRSSVLEDVCELICAFQEKKFDDLTLIEIEKALALVCDFERAGLKVDWLKKRLEDILETRKLIKQASTLKEARDKSNQVIIEKKRKLVEYEALMVVLQARMVVFQEKMANLQENMSLVKKELDAAQTEADKIKQTISNGKDKVIYFSEYSLLHEIL